MSTLYDYCDKCKLAIPESFLTYLACDCQLCPTCVKADPHTCAPPSAASVINVDPTWSTWTDAEILSAICIPAEIVNAPAQHVSAAHYAPRADSGGEGA